LKWDNNLWVNCDRSGHDHGNTDGSFAHVSALYEILDALRQRYPTLLIENCSQGGNRLDFGMLRYSDAAWMDDQTASAVHVRHNLEGLATIFPPAYLLSFVMTHDSEPLHDAPDLSLYFRSRMGGRLGLCFRSDELSEADLDGISHEIAIYKTVQATLGVATAALLTQQASVTGGPEWDVLQTTAPGSNALVVYAYQNDEGTSKINVKPADLQPATTYDVRSVDTGFLGTSTGADILANGIDVIESPNTAAHILTITATP
jgi:alpha-galactosidase